MEWCQGALRSVHAAVRVIAARVETGELALILASLGMNNSEATAARPAAKVLFISTVPGPMVAWMCHKTRS